MRPTLEKRVADGQCGPWAFRASRSSFAVAVALLAVLVLGSSTTVGAQTVSFIAPRDFGVGPSPVSVAMGDFNGDGVQDLAVADYDSDRVSVLMGNGDGSFQASHDFGVWFPINPAPVTFSPHSVAVGDFNGDGVQDLAVANVGEFGDCVGSSVSVLLGYGGGRFQPAQGFGLDCYRISVAVGDFNGDGAEDLAVASSSAGTVSVLLGNGDGSFQAAQNFGVGGSPVSVAVGDFNGDGKFDLAVANPGSNNVSVLINNTP